MEQLWAPWRMDLIRQPKMSGCFFCNYFMESNDEENLVLERGERCFVMFNRYPYTNGHLMVVPYTHTGDLTELDSQELSEMMELTVRWQDILRREICAHGFNIGMNLGDVAGAGVKDHAHMHIVPRWRGDTNFITTIGEVKVIPQSLEDLYSQLKRAIANG